MWLQLFHFFQLKYFKYPLKFGVVVLWLCARKQITRVFAIGSQR